jgi:hypothetical protein
MVEIKTAYLEEYKETLMDEIMIRYEDEQKNLLMALIKGKMMHLLILLLVFVVIQMTFQLFFLLNKRIFVFSSHGRMETRKEGTFDIPSAESGNPK